ncbi:MAG TPA: GAF domain-containing protein [Blastocatellia bacterium]|nr:GAF domain-containing protein [Blastocatellia bacterium]
MNKGDEDQKGYVNRGRENTKQFLEELLSENANLRTLVSILEDETRSLREQSLLQQLEINHYRYKEDELRQRLADTEAANRRLFERYVEVEQQNNNLANLYVASYRLHGTLDRQEVLAVIQEIIINLVGSEEMGIFELNEEGSALSLVASFGIEPTYYQTIPLGSGLIGRVVSTGETYVAGQGNGKNVGPDQTEETDLTACLSLKLGGKVTGAIVVFRLLQQKTGLEPVDYELLHLLAQEAATALYSTGLHAKLSMGTDVL